MGIVVIGDVFIDIKGYSTSPYIPQEGIRKTDPKFIK